MQPERINPSRLLIMSTSNAAIRLHYYASCAKSAKFYEPGTLFVTWKSFDLRSISFEPSSIEKVLSPFTSARNIPSAKVSVLTNYGGWKLKKSFTKYLSNVLVMLARPETSVYINGTSKSPDTSASIAKSVDKHDAYEHYNQKYKCMAQERRKFTRKTRVCASRHIETLQCIARGKKCMAKVTAEKIKIARGVRVSYDRKLHFGAFAAYQQCLKSPSTKLEQA